MTISTIIEEFGQKFICRVIGGEAGGRPITFDDDGDSTTWLRSTLTTFLEEKAQEIEKLHLHGNFADVDAYNFQRGRSAALDECIALLRKELNQ